MQIQINNVETGGTHGDGMRDRLRERLDRFDTRLTRVEVHLHDENGPRGGVDMRCQIEARPVGESPLSVSSTAETGEQAFNAALAALVGKLESHFGKRGLSRADTLRV